MILLENIHWFVFYGGLISMLYWCKRNGDWE